jgi:hypothetical protein
MLDWLAMRIEPIAGRLIKLLNYDRLTLWKKFLFSPDSVIKKEKKNATLSRAILDLAMCSLWYFVGIFWLIALSANSPLIFGLDGWVISALQKSIMLIMIFFLAVFSHWLVTNSLEYFFLPQEKARTQFPRQAYLSSLSFGSMAFVQMLLQLAAHAVALVLAATSVVALFLGDPILSSSMLDMLTKVFLFSSVFLPLLLQIFRIILQESILSFRRRLGNAKIAGLIIIEFVSLFSIFYVAAVAAMSILSSASQF